MGLFGKKKDGIYIVLFDDNSKEVYVEFWNEAEFLSRRGILGKHLRFDTEKEALRQAKSYARATLGWTLNKERCKL